MRPCVYTFRDAAGRATYVGKAGRNPGDRIKAHFDARAPHAVSAALIELAWLPHGTPEWTLDEFERSRIKALRPPSNKVHNWGAYDRVWAHRVAREHARVAGERLPVGDGVRLWLEALVARGRRAGRLLVGLVAVDVVLRFAVGLLT